MSEINNFFEEEQESINIKELLFRYFINWPWYIFCVLLAVISCYIFLKYQPNIYEAKASVLVVDAKPANPLGALSGSISSMFSQKDMIEDEIQLIKSLPIVTKTVEALELQTSYSFKTKLSKRLVDLYQNVPIAIEIFSRIKDYGGHNLSFKYLGNNKFEIINLSNDKKTVSSFNNRVAIDDNVTLIIKNKISENNKDVLNNEIFITIKTIEDAAFELIGNLKVEQLSKVSNAINISLQSTDLVKAKDIINELCNQYFKNSVDSKKISLNNTTEFIKERIILLDDELKSIENEIKVYKQNNQLTDFNTEAGIYSENIQKINEKVFEADLQLNLVKAINNKLIGTNNTVIPVNQGFSDATINATIVKYNELAIKYKNLSENVSSLNPERQSIEKMLNEAKKSIQDGLSNQKNVLEITLNKLKRESNIVDGKVKSIPRIENEMRNVYRQQQTKEALFLFLLQKREEVAVTITTLESNAKTINYAHGSKIPVAPKKPTILLAFLLAGLLIPTAIIYIKTLLDTKLHTINQLEKISKIPNIGFIPNHKLENRTVLGLEDRSSAAEGLRLMVTNIEFILSDINNCKSILLTSTFAGEGKSFIAANTASYLAYSGKKTILLGFDLRAPKVNEFFEYDNIYGITHYIKNQDLTFSDIITSISSYDNKLDVIHAGVTVPNFVELLKNNRITELFEYLKVNYDYIIIDSAPIGLVSDTLNLSKFADMCLYIFRAHEFDKSAIVISNKLFTENKFNRMHSILNGVDVLNKSYGYGYGYGYGSSYGYGDEDKKNKNIFKYKPWTVKFWKNLVS